MLIKENYCMLFFFHQTFVNVFNIISISSVIIYTKIIDISIKPCFFSYYLLNNLLKHFLNIMELLQSQNLLLQIFKFQYLSQTNSYLLHCNANLSKLSFFVTVKLIEYIFSAVKVCSNPCVGPFLRTNMSFLLLLMWIEKLIFTPKINTF